MIQMDKTAVAARFLLGGIGTGNISVDNNGRLVDWEIFNRPNKNFDSPYTFFAVHTQSEDGEKHTKALESKLQGPFNNSHGFHAWEIGGLPRFENSTMCGKYPFINIELTDTVMPIHVELEAFTPFIPLNTDDSSLPGAIIRYKIKNISNQKQEVSVAGSFANFSNYTEKDIWTKHLFDGVSKNLFVENNMLKGISFTSETKKTNEANYFDMMFATTEKENVSYIEYWNEGAWWDGIQDFWNDFSHDGQLDNNRVLKGKGNTMHKSSLDMSSLCVKKSLDPQEEAVYEFVLTWHNPNRYKSWWKKNKDTELVKNYYAKFGNSFDVANYLIENLPRLEKQSRDFKDAIFNSSYPNYVIDAITSTITVLRSNTCFRVEDGTFFAYEGQFDSEGCCDGSCTHVWNYAQTLAFLFPELERSMRETEFLIETNEQGKMMFRNRKYFGDDEFNMPPAADGQLGCIIRLYREWLFSGDDEFLKKLWPNAKKALEYAFDNWDKDDDGIIESQQHNTYDIEFYGYNSMMSSIYYTALLAGANIAKYLGDDESSEKYRDIQKKGSKKLDEETFNGEYYIQVIDDINEYKYQYGKGCLSDQLFGQQLAHINNLGYVLDESNVKTSVKSIFKYNFLQDFNEHTNLQRAYALNDDAGLILCSWKEGERPDIPFVYCDEVWSGIEYQVATHLIYEGFIDEAFEIVKATRKRHDGIKRSPWNEVECGHHYARSLASYGLLLSLSGFYCDGVNKTLTFNPVINQNDFKTFFTCNDGWGVYHQFLNKATNKMEYEIEVLYGSIEGYKIITNI